MLRTYFKGSAVGWIGGLEETRKAYNILASKIFSETSTERTKI
jgi:hypothetical protein